MPKTEPKKAESEEIQKIGKDLQKYGANIENYADQLIELGISDFMMSHSSQKDNVVRFARNVAKSVHNVLTEATKPDI